MSGLGHMGTFLNENGVPSECFRATIDSWLAGSTTALTYWCVGSYWRQRGQQRTQYNALGIRNRSLRFLALTISLCVSVYSLATSVPKYFVFPLSGIVALHFFELYVCPQIVASWELLLFWPFFIAVQTLRLLTVDFWVIVPTIVLPAVIIYAEVESSPKDVKGFDEANLYIRFGHSFMNRVIQRAQSNILTAEDLSVPPKVVTDCDTHHFAANYTALPVTGKLRIWLVMLWTTKRNVFLQGIFLFAVQTLNFLVPSVMREFLQYLRALEDTHSPASLNGSLWLGIALALTSLLYCALRGLNYYYDLQLSMEWRYTLSNYTYEKAMRIDSKSRQEYNSGKIMNLITNDVAEVQGSYGFLVEILKQPYGILLGSIQLYRILGPSFWYTFPLFTLHTICTSYIQNRASKGLPKQSAARDARNKSTLSILRNIKSLKLYAWEEPFEEKVVQDYVNERNEVKNYLKMSVGATSLTAQMSNILLGLIILSFLLTSPEPLTPDTLFPLIKLTMVAMGPYSDIPNLWRDFTSMMNSEQRLNEFYQQPEKSKDNYFRQHLGSHQAGSFEVPRISICKATIAWPHSSVALENLNLELCKGDMLCVLGKIGTGKSALIQAIAGQMSVVQGSVVIRGSMAYASQEPWLQFQSIRDNILFGLEYDEKFYNQVVGACELVNDLQIFPEKDSTMVGEKGITLSGGQKARLALARAIYSRADVLVLDDVLSAVDQHVCQSLLLNLFSPEFGIAADKAVILATHSSKALKFCNKVLSLGPGGQVRYYGTASGAPAIVADSISGEDTSEMDMKDLLPGCDRQGILTKAEEQPANPRNQIPPPQEEDDSRKYSMHAFSKTFSKSEKPRTISIVDALKRYFQLGSKTHAAITITSTVFRTVASFVTTLWLSYWSGKQLSGFSASKIYLLVYFVLLLLQVLSDMTSRFTFQAVMVTEIATKIHNRMLHTVIHSPMQYFESTPLGTIINRFTGDLAKADRQFPGVAFNFVLRWITAGTSFILALIGAPFIIVFALPLIIQGKRYKDQYLPATSQATNLMAASRAPVLSHVEESTKGFTTVAAFGKSERFIDGMANRLRYQSYCTYNASAIRRWLLTRVMVISAVITGAAAISLVAGVQYLSIPVSLAGVTLLTIEKSNSQMRGILMGFQRFEQATNSVERLFTLIDQPTEAAYHLPSDTAVNSNWLQRGQIKFDAYSTSFRSDLPAVLHNINLDIKPKEKIGVIGRTGAGKTTLTLALFRILEAQTGSVRIDHTDISALGLYNLRSHLSSIPQDAQIFKGTLRENLDPMAYYTDGQLWDVLKLCHLHQHFSSLDVELDEGGGNISRGQAQLICLGRALLRPSKILVLDEATASVDGNTDSVVQRTIRSAFADRTIITIAHRLDTIMDSDRVLVLSEGHIVEQGPPQELLAQKGHFYALVNSSI